MYLYSKQFSLVWSVISLSILTESDDCMKSDNICSITTFLSVNAYDVGECFGVSALKEMCLQVH